jgi:hypothetical protein
VRSYVCKVCGALIQAPAGKPPCAACGAETLTFAERQAEQTRRGVELVVEAMRLLGPRGLIVVVAELTAEFQPRRQEKKP